MISDRDVTFVVQGPLIIDKGINYTERSLKSIKRCFPESKIIFSTWEGTQISEDLADIIIYNVDPAIELKKNDNTYFLNLIRQIVSTNAGFKKVRTKYAVKVRSDCFFKNNSLLSLLKEENVSDFFSQRVLVSSTYSYIPEKSNYCFFISDMLLFGLKKDLLKIFSLSTCAKVTKDSVSLTQLYKKPLKFVPLWCEQEIWIRSIENYLNITDYTNEKNQSKFMKKHHLFCKKNLVFYELNKLGIFFQKYPKLNYYELLDRKIYSHAYWKKYFGKSISPLLFFKELSFILWKIFPFKKLIQSILKNKMNIF